MTVATNCVGRYSIALEADTPPKLGTDVYGTDGWGDKGAKGSETRQQ